MSFARPLDTRFRLRRDGVADAGQSPELGTRAAGPLYQQIVHALAMWTITLCHSRLLPNMQPEDTTLTMIERITTAMADLDALDSFRD